MKSFNPKNWLKTGTFLALFSFLSLFIMSCGNDDDGGAPAPQDIVDIAIANGYNTLAAALEEAGLVDDLQASGPFTVFAPTDAAFQADGRENC